MLQRRVVGLPSLLLLLLFVVLSFSVVAHAFKPAAAPVPGVSATARTCPSPSSSAMASSSSASSTEGSGSSGSGSKPKPIPISRIGFGTYRVGSSKDQEAAIREALLNGLTLIDTSANYGDGDSERTIGTVVRALVDEGKLKREDLVLVSKVSQP